MALSHTLLRLAVRPMHLRKHVVARRTVSTHQKYMNVLGIETSADDTCVALMALKVTPEAGDVGRLIHSVKTTLSNKKHQGIHPVEAVISHTQNLSRLLHKLPLRREKPDLICVTRGPGMGGCLSVGVSTAKALAVVWNIPIVGVHHMQAHALTPFMERALNGRKRASYPFLSLLVSGKHTMLVYTKSPVSHRILAQTKTNALGDAMDKVARELVPSSVIESQPENEPICYPDLMEKMTMHQCADFQPPQTREAELRSYESDYGWVLNPPLRGTRRMMYDFNALASATLTILRAQLNMSEAERCELGTSFMRLAFEHLMSRVIMALEDDDELLRDPPKILILSGGVASNNFLRRVIMKTLNARGWGDVELVVPRIRDCTDNAKMIAYAGWKMYTSGWSTDTSFCPAVKWSIEEILSGVDCWTRRAGFPHITPENVQSANSEPSQASNKVAPANTLEASQDPIPSTLEREELFPGGALSSPKEPHSSRLETSSNKTVELPSEISQEPGPGSSTLEERTIDRPSETTGLGLKSADALSKSSGETAIDKASGGPVQETDEVTLQIEQLKKALSSLQHAQHGSHTPASKSADEAPERTTLDMSKADRRKHRRLEIIKQRKMLVAAKRLAKSMKAAAKEPTAKRNISAKEPTAAPVAPKQRSSPTAKRKISVKKPAAAPVAPKQRSSAVSRPTSAHGVKTRPPMPPPEERHDERPDVMVHYVGFADEPAVPARKVAPTLMSKMASMFGLRWK